MLSPNLQALRDDLRARPILSDEQHGLLAELDALVAPSATRPAPSAPNVPREPVAVGARALVPAPGADLGATSGGNMVVTVTADGDIAMSPIGDQQPSEDQQVLVLLVERTLAALRLIYRDRPPAMQQRFAALLALAQVGLAGAHPTPGLARRMLEQLRADIVEREAGRLKQAHMQVLGAACLRLGAPALAVGLLALAAGASVGLPPMIATMGLLWAACASGVWVSFAARKSTYEFEDLTLPEKDFVSPTYRVVFAGMLTTVLALLFHSQAATVALGSVSTAGVLRDPLLAVLTGFLCGFSEQVLAQAVRKQASRLLQV